MSRLLPGEDIVVDVHPHVRTIAGPVLAALLLTAVTAALGWRLRDEPQTVLPIAAAGTALVAFALAGPLLRWRATALTVTTHRLIVRSGLLARSHHDLPLLRIDELLIERGLADRLLGTGSLVVQPTGDRPEIIVPDVPRLSRVCRTVGNLVEARAEYGDLEDHRANYRSDYLGDEEETAERRSR